MPMSWGTMAQTRKGVTSSGCDGEGEDVDEFASRRAIDAFILQYLLGIRSLLVLGIKRNY